MNVSSGEAITSLTDAEAATEVAVRLDEDELRRLQQALEAIDGSSSAARLARAIAHAVAHGNTLVLGYREAPGRGEEDDLVERVRALIDHLVPDLDLPSEAATILARRNAKRRGELLQEFGALSGEQIADERSRAANRHALAARWRKEGKLFGVLYRGQILYPAFQFDDDGALRPVVAAVLTALPRDDMSDWEVALWWTAANGMLHGERPVDLLDQPPEQLVAAAGRLREPLPL